MGFNSAFKVLINTNNTFWRINFSHMQAAGVKFLRILKDYVTN